MSAFTYPGVCTLKSFSSDVHIITGVATSYRGIHRLGRPRASRRSHARRELIRLPEYLRRSGFPESARLRGQPVFGNGGQQAYIVRVVWDGTLPAAPGSIRDHDPK